jgi:elongation of very long chain fatty acids protein 6
LPYPLLEFGDTVFVVLRKTPLNFLHWYHHISVFAYCAYSVGYADPTSEWFGVVNLFVHSVMYSYYVLKAVGVKVPRAVAQCITALQLSQFGVGLTVIGVAFAQHRAGVACVARKDVLWSGLLMYISYMVLFGNFFYQRYLRRK